MKLPEQQPGFPSTRLTVVGQPHASSRVHGDAALAAVLVLFWASNNTSFTLRCSKLLHLSRPAESSALIGLIGDFHQSHMRLFLS